jgi:uncharacterized protein YsxB (DUF464 family)
MIRVEFGKVSDKFYAVTVSGHANFAELGKDIVCAAVTSAFQLCANAITENLGLKDAEVVIGENIAGIELPKNPSDTAEAFIAALWLHLSLLEVQYPKNIKVTTMEV